MDAMTTDRSFRRSAPFAVMLVAGLAGAGCLGEEGLEEEEPTEVVTSAFNEGGCATATADAAMIHPSIYGFNDEMSRTSPTSYNTCWKGYVVDIWHNEANLGHSQYGWVKDVTVKWAGPVPTTQSACQAITGSVIVYDYDDFANPFWTGPSRNDIVATWFKPIPVLGLPGICSIPTVTVPIYPTNLEELPWATRMGHRVAATMRSNNETRPVKISVRTKVFGNW